MANAETTRAMQEALEAAVARMNTGQAESRSLGPIGPDLMGTLMTVVPKLLQNSGAGQEMLERLDTLQKGDLAGLKEQVLILRKQCHRMLKFQEQLLVKVHEIQRQQVAAAGAVLDLAQQMARITFVDDDGAGADDRDDRDDRDDETALPVGYHADVRMGRNGTSRPQGKV